MHIRISTHPVRLELRAFRPAGNNCAIVHSTEHDTYRYLKAHIRQPSIVAELRKLLAGRGARPMVSDDDVLHEAALEIMMERLFLIQAQQAAAAGFATGEAEQDAPAEAPRRPAVRPPAPLPPPRKPEFTETPPPAPESTAALAQDVQAASLELAAAQAVPFCEVCERARAAPGAA